MSNVVDRIAVGRGVGIPMIVLVNWWVWRVVVVVGVGMDRVGVGGIEVLDTCTSWVGRRRFVGTQRRKHVAMRAREEGSGRNISKVLSRSGRTTDDLQIE